MRRRTVWIAVCAAAVAALFAAPGCGGDGGGAGSAAHEASIREVLTTVLVCAAKGDSATAAPHLDVAGFRDVHGETRPKPWNTLSEEEKTRAANECFNQTLQIPKQTTLKDQAAIAAALAAGTTTVLERIHKGEVAFQGPAADGKPVSYSYIAKLTLGTDHRWRLVSLTEQFR